MALIALLALVVTCHWTASLETDLKFKTIIDQINSGQNTWEAGENFGPTISDKAISRLLGSTFDQLFEKGPVKKADSKAAIPPTFDARKIWPHCPSIGHVRDQGYCGSCWAVAAAASLTDRYCIATKGKFKADLSMEDILSCCHECGEGCEGGSPWYAWYHFWRQGIVSGGDHGSKKGCKPYSFKPCEHHTDGSRPKCESFGELPTPKCDYECSNEVYRRGFWSDHHRVTDFYHLNETEKIQREIMDNGPVEASFLVYEDFLVYKKGVYVHSIGERKGGHAIKLIGWGTENNTPYWLAVNSWNSDWGDEGTFKILRGSNHCRIESFIMTGIPDIGYL